MYRVAEPRVVISFTSNYVLSDLEDSRVNFPDDRFRFHSYEEFEAACDLKGDPYGALALVSMSSSRVFLDFDVQLTRDYVTWVDAKVVTKTETMTIEELFSYIKQEAAKVRSSAKVDKVLFFRDVSFGIQEGELRFRLIHLWEARNVLTKTLIGLEMLLIDEQGSVIQGFIPSARIDTYLPHMKAGSVYRLNKCFGSNSKVMYRVAEPRVVISFTSNSVLSDLEDSRVNFPDDRFRFHSYKEFEAACDLKGDLYDYVGHLKLVNGQTLNASVVLDEEEIASTRRLLLHVQTHDGPVMKLYLWDQAAADFCAKFKLHGSTPRVILVTTVNPKRFGGALALASMSSSRVFLDFDVQPTRDYVTWLDSNLDVANRVDAKVVT
ncbi:BnaC03g67500D [Brassica napus]|uniref:BnaC03g67500D protein n=1 Tax=Brassica napus TaxID=3708 RepID=A0A078HPT7_BRANA|nr:BnaC03g67500D [Brassica napus]